jgi:hypothetical protein
MSVRRFSSALTVAAVLACWPLCHGARAEVAFSPFELASADPALGLQAEYAYEPAISADGGFVAFTGVIASKNGVFRKNLATGELQSVALGTGAGSPSISADGRYVSFTTSDDPVTGAPAGEGCTQVYVRDMDQTGIEKEHLEPGPASAYWIVSAPSRSKEPLKYEGPEDQNGKCPEGSASANRVAISADGSKVAFTVIGKSNLVGNPAAIETPPEQVAVRALAHGDFENETTTLVSVVQGGSEQPVGGGAALSGRPSVVPHPRPNGGTIQVSHDDVSTAAISADGSTVAWMGVNIAQQAPVAPSAQRFVLKPEPAFQYAEPLWRRIAPEPGATRRVLAGDEEACPPSCAGGLDLGWEEQRENSGEEPLGPQYGSDIDGWHRSFSFEGALTPQLSANGEQVAILSTQPDYGHPPDFGNNQTDKEKTPDTNAFVVSMAPGLTREQAITRLTDWGSPDFSNTALDGSIGEVAISGDGTRVAFATERNVFALAPPALITAPVSQLEPPQLYEVDLQAGTLALVSEGYNGEPANREEGKGGVSAASLSGDGTALTLASGSSNLAYGTVNEGSAVFVTTEQESPAEPGSQSVSPLPPGPAAETAWSISATAGASHGALVIDVSVPGAGRLGVSASAPVPVRVPLRAASRKPTTRVPSGHASAARARMITVIATRQVAHAAVATRNEGLVQLRLLPSGAYRSLAYGRGGLYATISVTFSAPGHHTLTKTLKASFPRLYATRKQSKPPARKLAHKSSTTNARGRR